MDSNFKIKPIRILIHTKRWYHYLPDIIRYFWRLTRSNDRVIDINIRISFTNSCKAGIILDHNIKEVNNEPDNVSCNMCALYDKEEDICSHEDFDCKTNIKHLNIDKPVWCPLQDIINSLNEYTASQHQNGK